MVYGEVPPFILAATLALAAQTDNRLDLLPYRVPCIASRRSVPPVAPYTLALDFRGRATFTAFSNIRAFSLHIGIYKPAFIFRIMTVTASLYGRRAPTVYARLADIGL